MKVFAAVEVYSGAFIYRPDQVFNGETYLDFLEERLARRYCRRGQTVIYIHDNAPCYENCQALSSTVKRPLFGFCFIFSFLLFF